MRIVPGRRLPDGRGDFAAVALGTATLKSLDFFDRQAEQPI
jgi:hypothetical protein